MKPGRRTSNLRAEVGPIRLWTKVPIHCLALLDREGLKPSSRVLDVGAGVLRVGRVLMALLDPGCYHAIEPNGALIEAAHGEPGIPDLISSREASWSPSADIVATSHVAPGSIDFVLCHGVVHHAPIAWIELLARQSMHYLKPGGKLLFTYLVGPKPYGGDEWCLLPRHVTYPWTSVRDAMARAGMPGQPIKANHPGGRIVQWVRGVK